MHSLREIEAVFFDLDDTLYDQLIPFQMALEYCDVIVSTEKIEELFRKGTVLRDILWKVHTGGEMSLEEFEIAYEN